MKVCRVSQSRSAHVVPYGSKVRERKKSPFNLRRCVSTETDSESSTFLKVRNDLRFYQQFCDGTLHSNDGKTFYIHRIILCAASPYFEVLFTNSLNGGKPEISEVSLDIPGHILDLILDYTYTGHCKVNSENIEHLLPIADQYAFLGVLHQCCKFLLENLQPENCLGIFKFARHYFCHDLEYEVQKYIFHNFKQILQHSPEFEDLSAEELEVILCDDELNIHNEKLVFEAVIRWTEADLQAREQYLSTLIHCVRYGLMNLSFFTDVMNNKLILANQEVQRSLHPVSVYFTEPDSRQRCVQNLNNKIACPRIPHEILFAVCGWRNLSTTSFFETYDTRADKWYKCWDANLTARAYHGLCAIDNLIYVVGGCNCFEILNTMYCYNPVTQKWTERACMHHARFYVSVCAEGGKIYALGGHNGRKRMNSAERYSPDLNQWQIIPPMQCVRSDACAASLKGKIYVVGGLNGQQGLRSAEVFDPETNQWRFIHSMSTIRSGVSLVAYEDYLYAIGGYSGSTRLKSGERYSPSHSSDWEHISEMSAPRSNFAAVVLDGMIFALGGFNGSTTVSDVEYYDPKSNEWHKASSMNMNLSGLKACVLSGLPNAKEFYVSRVGH